MRVYTLKTRRCWSGHARHDLQQKHVDRLCDNAKQDVADSVVTASQEAQYQFVADTRLCVVAMPVCDSCKASLQLLQV